MSHDRLVAFFDDSVTLTKWQKGPKKNIQLMLRVGRQKDKKLELELLEIKNVRLMFITHPTYKFPDFLKRIVDIILKFFSYIF
jgi:hypothetical protein